ncbi:hypothetical protein HU200_002789 [Digitaria exilis]|uniref:Glycosyltransferase n=1 Tax=Digitaria exilis TaxID=1010633 RepID=A0A835FXL4_9POAL|nr:hypothetical protein HU200_002789 [Digitaria exilis]CAB3467843.1 unnamed protein product [Digitaria exilis]
MATPAMQSPAGELISGSSRPHVMFIPSAGMGHLLPFFRVITALATRDDVDVSVVTVLPTVSAAEADHLAGLFSAFPTVRSVDLHLLPFDASEFPGHDPFVLRWESLRRSVHLLGPLISGASPRVSAIVTDVTLTSHVVPIARELGVQCHVLFVSCATMLSLLAYVPVHLSKKAEPGPGVGDVDIPGVQRLPQSYLPQWLLDLNKLFTKQFIDNGREIINADGFLVNTFDALEPVALAALRNGKVIAGFPPVYAIGPLQSQTSATEPDGKQEHTGSPVAWLDEQPARSVVYVAFGNRSAVGRDQLREIAAGLEASGCRFLWVLKTTTVDRDDTAELTDVLGEGFLERVRGRGMVTKAWVDQEAVLRHPSVGLFLSHSGWNSVTEAATAGVPLLAWPRLGDHRVNATVVVSGGVGVWMEHWSWDGEDRLVTGEEIGEKVKEVMSDATVRARAARTSEEAAKAIAEGGTSYRSLQEFIGKLKATQD